MSKFNLELEEDFDFFLVGICSHIKDYRLSWELNQALDITLEKAADLEIMAQGECKSFSFNQDEDESRATDYYLISNKSAHGYLLAEEKKCDFLLIVKGFISEEEEKSLIKTINQSKNVLTSYVIEVDNLKSKHNLIF